MAADPNLAAVEQRPKASDFFTALVGDHRELHAVRVQAAIVDLELLSPRPLACLSRPSPPRLQHVRRDRAPASRRPAAPAHRAIRNPGRRGAPGHSPDRQRLQRRARTVIERQVGKINLLVDELLEVSCTTTGRIHLRQEQIALGGIIERAVETVQPLIAQRRHELIVTLPPEPLWLHADASPLKGLVLIALTGYGQESDRQRSQQAASTTTWPSPPTSPCWRKSWRRWRRCPRRTRLRQPDRRRGSTGLQVTAAW